MANKIELSHEKTSKGSNIQHIIVNGIELSGRVVTKSADSDMYNDLIEYLNMKAQKELELNPRFAWLTLGDWRRWANRYIEEFNNVLLEEKEKDILKSIEDNN